MLYPQGQRIRLFLFGVFTQRICHPKPIYKNFSLILLVRVNKNQRKVSQKPKYIPITNISLLKTLTIASLISRVTLNFSIQRFWRHGMIVTSGLVDKINTVIAVSRLTSSSSWCVPSTKEKMIYEKQILIFLYLLSVWSYL